MLVVPSFKESLIVEQFQGNYLKLSIYNIIAWYIIVIQENV